MLTADQLRVVRTWIGDKTPPTDADLNSWYDLLESPKAVVNEVLRRRLANFTAKAASFTIPQQYSQSTVENIRELRKQLIDLALQPADLGVPVLGVPSGFGVSRIVRPGRR